MFESPTSTASAVPTVSAERHDGQVRYASIGRTIDLHPIWLREQSQEPGQIERRIGSACSRPVTSTLI